MKTYLFIFCFILAASSEAASFYEVYWLKLLHYKNGHSLAKGKDFFLSAKGAEDPQAELQATLDAFKDPNAKVGQFKLHPICAFPERYRFLKEQGLTQVSPRECEDFSFWKKGLDAQSLTLVFSTAFPNDPSSMFGHTFIRFNQKQEGKNDLLDYGANYAAFIEDPDPNPFEYAYRGLVGGYKGYFGFSPYYMKVNEYINTESRDLYEYDLNISPENIERLINHLWEIYATTYFDYYFLDENCSYMLGDFIEVAMPEWNLTKTGRPFYLPSDLIKKITAIPHAVKAIHYRPSLKKRFQASLDILNSDQKEEFNKLIKGEIFPRQEKNYQVLDAFLYFKEYGSNKKRENLQGKELGEFREALMTRAAFKEKSPELIILPNESKRPELSHGPQRISFGGGFDKDQENLRFSYRLGSHNYMARDDGLENFGHFEMFSLVGSFQAKEKKIKLEEAQLIRIFSLFPQEEYDSRLSWTAGGGIERIREDNCLDCQRFQFDGALGKTFKLTEKNLWTVLIGTYGEFSSHYENDLRFGPLIQTFLLGNPFAFYKYKIGSKIKSDFLTQWKTHYSIETSFAQTFFFKTNFELRWDSKWWSRFGSFSKNTYEHQLELAYYF